MYQSISFAYQLQEVSEWVKKYYMIHEEAELE